MPAARFLLFLAVAPMLAQVGSSSGGAGQEPVLRITVNLVQVDAVVTDSRGRQVTDLTADDFEVLEDGRPQKITAFSYVRVAGPQPARGKAARPTRPAIPPPSGTPLAPQQVRRTIVLMADDLGLSFESTARVRRALKKFVDQQMQEGDLVAIIRTRGGMGSLEQFTSDKNILYAAIDRVRWYPGGMGGAGALEPIGYDALPNAAQMRMGGPGGASPQTGGSGQRHIEEGGNENFWIGTLAAINLVVRELRELPGRKAVVLFSDGMPVFLPKRPQLRTVSDMRELTDQANRSAVLIYAVDARGLETTSLTAADQLDDATAHPTPAQIAAEKTNRQEQYVNSQQGLDFLARRTGGFVIHDSNDLNWGLGRVLDDLSGYYLIGYKPDESSFEAATGQRRFHRLQVKVGVRGLEARSRTGYFGLTDEQARPVYRTRVEQLAAALTSPFNSADLKVRLTCLFSEEANSGAVVRVLLHVDAEGLTFSEEAGGMRKTVLELVTLAFDEKGESHGTGDRKFTFGLSGRQYQQALRSGILFTEGLALEKPGAYQMRVAVRDPATGKVGSATQFVEIPDVRRHRLAISGINLNGVHANNADGEQESSDVARADTPAVRVFQRGEGISYACVIFDAQRDRTTGQSGLETQLLLYRDARQIYAGAVTPFQADGQRNPARLVLAGELPRDTLAEPGEYVLEIAAWDKLAPRKYQTASQWIDLEVVK